MFSGDPWHQITTYVSPKLEKLFFSGGWGGNPHNLSNCFLGLSELDKCGYLLAFPVLKVLAA